MALALTLADGLELADDEVALGTATLLELALIKAPGQKACSSVSLKMPQCLPTTINAHLEKTRPIGHALERLRRLSKRSDLLYKRQTFRTS